MGFRIEEMQPADVSELKAFMANVIAEGVTRDPELLPALVANTASNVDWWLANPEQCCHLKCVIGGEIAGVVLVKNHWNLCSLFVAPHMHRKGIGRALMAAAIDACRGKSEKNAIWLNAAPEAISFYVRLGFRPRQAVRSLPPGFAAMQFAL